MRNGLVSFRPSPRRMLSRGSLSLGPDGDQIMSMPSETARRWTAREVRDLIAAEPLATPRYELVDGELLVTPSSTRDHQRVVGKLLYELMTYLRAQKVGEALTSPSDVELESESIVQPDIYVLPPEEQQRTEFPVYSLLVAIEVLSPSSARYDRVTKRSLYQRRVPEYWIVDLDARVIERWRPDESRPEIVTDELVWHPGGASAAFRLDVPAFFGRVR
jgi:Uma2 family endonuclease